MPACILLLHMAHALCCTSAQCAAAALSVHSALVQCLQQDAYQINARPTLCQTTFVWHQDSNYLTSVTCLCAFLQSDVLH